MGEAARVTFDADEGDIGLAIHAVAAATIAAVGATREQLDLSRSILRVAASREMPREAEIPAQVFARQLDAAIDSCNRSASCSTRSQRRVALAADLSRRGLVLLDRNVLAELVEAKFKLDRREELLAHGTAADCAAAGGIDHHEEDLGAELLDEEGRADG